MRTPSQPTLPERRLSCQVATAFARSWIALLVLGAVLLVGAEARAQSDAAETGDAAAAAHKKVGVKKKKRKKPVDGDGAGANEAERQGKGESSAGDKSEKKKGKHSKGCPSEMASIHGQFCIDRWEAYTVELGADAEERKHSPFEPVANLAVRAKSAAGRLPQGYISRDEAAEACKHAGKRLCTDEEWLTACKGKKPTVYPYGDEWQAGRCNDQGFSSFNHLYGGDGQPPAQAAYNWENMNDPRLNQLEGTLAAAGKFKRCRNGFGVYDMVGNLHEWTAAPAGTFRGGYYLDVHQNGDGCGYRTTAHGPRYHDYSTGFRCCK